MALIEQKLSQTTKKAEDLIQQNEEKEFIFPEGNIIKENNIGENNNAPKESLNDVNNSIKK